MFEEDPFGKVKTEPRNKALPAREVNKIHEKSDVDSAPTAQHHTVGTDRNQAAAGSHTHGGKDSVKIGTGLGLAVTGSRGGNAAVTSLLTELAKVISFTNNTTP
jgi:hypothetical protein